MIRTYPRKTMTYILVLVICFCLPRTAVSAVLEPYLPCKLNVWLHWKYGRESLTLKGVEISIYQIAGIRGINEKGKILWEYADSFRDFPIRLNTLETEGVSTGGKEIETMLNYISAYSISGQRVITDEVGRAQFENLWSGLYLVVQTTIKEDKKEIIPFLIPLPICIGKDQWEYDVTVYPKLIEEDPPAIGSGIGAAGDVLSQIWGLPRTGLMIIPIFLLITLGFGLLFFGLRLVLKKEEQKSG